MFSRLLIAAALVAGTPLIGASVVPGLSQAHATDFKGKIKNIRIKRKRVGSGFKVRAVGEAAAGTAVVGGNAIIRSASTGEVVTAVELDTARRGRLKASTALEGELTAGDALTVVITAGQVQADGSVEGPAEPIVVPIELVATAAGRVRGDGASEQGWKARVRTTRDGALIAVVLHENNRWTGTGVEALSVESPAGAQELGVDTVLQTNSGTVNADLEALGVLQVDATIELADGTVLTRTDVIDPDPQPAQPGLEKITARQTRNGDAKLVTITEGEDLSLAVELTDTTTGEAVINTVDETPVSTVRVYQYDDLAFDPGEDPAGHPYLVLIDLIDLDGNPFGEQYEAELTLPPRVEGEASVSAAAPFGDGVGQVIAIREGEFFTLSVGLRNADAIASVNLIFEEPWEGPGPLETEVNGALVGQLNKWVQTGDAALPANFSLATTLTNAGGEVVAGTQTSGTSGGVMYSNGKGTKKATVQVRQNSHIQLL